MSIPGAEGKEGHGLGLGARDGVPTQWQLKARVKEDAVESRILGARNLVVGHDDLGVEREPFPRALLWGGNGVRRAPRSLFLAPQPQHAGSGPRQDGEGSAWSKGQLGVAQVPWGSAGRWLCPAPYLIGLPDGPEGDPHRAHHGVPDEPLVPHLHGQAQVQSIDLTGDRKGIRLSTMKLTPLRLPLLNSPLGPPQLLPVPSGPGLR